MIFVLPNIHPPSGRTDQERAYLFLIQGEIVVECNLSSFFSGRNFITAQVGKVIKILRENEPFLPEFSRTLPEAGQL
jgi:hypothetical protein